MAAFPYGYLFVGIMVAVIVLLFTSSEKDGPVCKSCSKRNRIGAQFCGQCGEHLHTAH
ncbi:MAG: hypothetical protein ACPGXK_05065 [Phycisphaerae bacterium]